MNPSDIGLFTLAEQRLAWVDKRQQLLAQNVANANTPGFQPKDLTPFDRHMKAVSLAQTSPMHIAVGSQSIELSSGKRAEISATGNSVSLESQMAKVADTASTQQLVLNLERSYMGMFRTVIGRTG